VTEADTDTDERAPLAGRFVDGYYYGPLQERVRTHLVHEHLRPHLPLAQQLIHRVELAAASRRDPYRRLCRLSTCWRGGPGDAGA
jgi:hypothetical protein